MILSSLKLSNKAKPAETMNNFITLISKLIEKSIHHSPYSYPEKYATYRLTLIPDISIEDYLKRFVKYLGLRKHNLINVLVYMERFLISTKLFITKTSIYGILTALILCNHKFTEDNPVTNRYIARLAGLSLETVNALEVQMLFDLKFALFISPTIYVTYKELLAKVLIEQAKCPLLKAALETCDSSEMKTQPSKPSYSPRFQLGLQKETAKKLATEACVPISSCQPGHC